MNNELNGPLLAMMGISLNMSQRCNLQVSKIDLSIGVSYLSKNQQEALMPHNNNYITIY